MTVLRTIAIIFIFFCSVVAWVVLGGTLVHRTDKAKEFGADAVGQLWGTEQRQRAPTFHYMVAREIDVEAGEGEEAEKTEKKVVYESVYVEPDKTEIDADFKLEHRKKGLLWFSTYVVKYSSTYSVTNDTAEPRKIFVTNFFPATNALYDDFTFRAKGEEVRFPPGAAESLTTTEDYTYSDRDWETDFQPGVTNSVTASFNLAPGESADVEIGYKSPGMDRWRYAFSDGVSRVRDFTLKAHTDFDAVDFPEGCVSPTAKEKTADGWDLTWQYKDLVTGYQLGVEMPKKLNPGPIASRMSFFAPVSLLFFFTVLFIISAVKADKITPLHPMNYFFLAAAFFAFHLLFAYLADHIGIHLTFLASALVSCILVFVYVALARGARYAFAYATFPQLMFLVLFSYAFFYPGYTGLIITIGAIVTLAVLMVATARVDWSAKFGAKHS